VAPSQRPGTTSRGSGWLDTALPDTGRSHEFDIGALCAVPTNTLAHLTDIANPRNQPVHDASRKGMSPTALLARRRGVDARATATCSSGEATSSGGDKVSGARQRCAAAATAISGRFHPAPASAPFPDVTRRTIGERFSSPRRSAAMPPPPRGCAAARDRLNRRDG
jgi:hypothetical protein